MAVTRRDLLITTGAAAGGTVLLPAVVRTGAAFGQAGVDPAAAKRNRLVVIFLFGGNDGLNTVIPRGDLPKNPRLSVYKRVRPEIGYEPNESLPLDKPQDKDEKLGLHPSMKTFHRLYKENRLAVVQGVDYPNHNYSHFESADIWHTGAPDQVGDAGWIGRHLDRVGIGEGELRALAVSRELPLTIKGRNASGLQLASLQATRFSDGSGPEADLRHAALAQYRNHPRSEPLRSYAGRACSQTVGMVEKLERAKVPRGTANALANTLLTARTLFEQNLGVETVFLYHDGFDTHTGQRAAQTELLARLDAGIEAFFYGTINGTATGAGPMSRTISDRMMVMVVSEFGRRIGENGGGDGAGTDHGAAGPVLLLGPPAASPQTRKRLMAGLHGDHPPMGTTQRAEDNLRMTTDLRRVYQSVLTHWFHDPDPTYGNRYAPIPGLFR